jgi:hypothetical protein
MDFIELLLKAGLSDHKLASATLGLNRTTIIRLRKGEIKPKKHLIMLLQMMGGEVVTNARYNFFKGWKFNNDYLISPEGEKFTEGDIRAARFEKERLREQERTIKRLKQENEELRNNKPKRPNNVVMFPNKRAN